MRALIYLFFFCALAIGLQAQQASNVMMLGGWTDSSLPSESGVRFNDVWGYATGGREFAIMGSREKVHFFEVTDPANILEIAAFAGGSNTTWRDMKTYQHYAYAVADSGTGEGLMIFDLSNITGTGNNRVTLANQITDDFLRSHNVFVDEPNGILYVVSPGASTDDNLMIYDLNTDPENPEYIGQYRLGNADLHDIYVENHIGYLSLLTDGLRVFDMSPATDPAEGAAPGTPVELGVLNDYPYNVFNHSSWKNGDVLVFADERHGTPLRIVDVSDVSDMNITDDFNSNLLGVADPYRRFSPPGPIAHNPFILGNLCIVSYYHDGVVIYDISDPNNVVNVGHYDTDLASTTYAGYKGCWGTYPFLPSGRILASDVLNGLHVLEFNAALPVEWGSFTAQKDGEQVRLDWTTTKEEDNAGFTVERALADNTWIAISEVAPNEKQQYRSYDPRPRTGWNTYRIKQTDYDGTSAYSRLVNVFWGADDAEWIVYPNPVPQRGTLQLRNLAAGTSTWRLLNDQGQEVLRAISDNATGQAQIILPDLPAGTYWLEEAETRGVRRVVIF